MPPSWHSRILISKRCRALLSGRRQCRLTPHTPQSADANENRCRPRAVRAPLSSAPQSNSQQVIAVCPSVRQAGRLQKSLIFISYLFSSGLLPLPVCLTVWTYRTLSRPNQMHQACLHIRPKAMTLLRLEQQQQQQQQGPRGERTRVCASVSHPSPFNLFLCAK